MLEKYLESEGVYCLGDPAGPSCDFEFVWLVYDYESGSYDGSGTAVALGKDGKLYHTDLGHCSCYGPFEGAWTEVKLSDFKTDSVHDLGSTVTLEDAVMELMGK